MKRFFKIVIGLIGIFYLVVVVKAFFTDPAREMNFSPDRSITVIAHAGGAGVSPSNTLYALKRSADIGVDILEFDIHASADGQLVVIHDRSVDRTTNGTGNVQGKTVEELKSLDAAYYFSPDPEYSNMRDFKRRGKLKNPQEVFPLRGKGIKIPLLEEVFDAFPNKRMIIEIKQKSPSIAGQFCQMIRSRGRQQDIIVGSFHQQALGEFREACPEVPTSMTPREGLIFYVSSKILMSRALSPDAVALQFPGSIKIPEPLSRFGDFETITHRLVKEAHRKNMPVQVWTVNDPEEMKRLIELKVDGIMTDYPQRLIDLLKSKNL